MKRYFSSIITMVLFLAFLGIGSMASFAVNKAEACGWGQSQSGGQDYVPQRRDSNNLWSQNSALSMEQAQEIATNYVKRLNPSLAIGKITDNGNFYEAEIVSEKNEVVQLLGVDKLSGRLMVLN